MSGGGQPPTPRASGRGGRGSGAKRPWPPQRDFGTIVFLLPRQVTYGKITSRAKPKTLCGEVRDVAEVLKVSSRSSPNAVAGALAGVIREKGSAEVQAIGAGAINQAVKAVAIARGFVAPGGIDLICIPAFTDVNINGEERTAIKFIVEPR